MSFRKVLLGLLISVVSISIVGALWITGCKASAKEVETMSVEEETESAVVETPTETETPIEEGKKYGGTLVGALDSEPMHLDPHLGQQNLLVAISDLFFDFLWRWNENFTELVPHIAEKWEWIDDLNLKVFIRKGIKFHDGSSLTADDVKFSLDRILDPKTASPWASFLEPIKEVTVDDEYSLTIKLKKPWYGLLDRLTYIAIVSPEAVEKYGDLKTHPVGCGPFVFETWEPGLEIRAKKFEDYYMEGQPYLDGVVLKFMSEYPTAKSALVSGDIDIIFWPDPKDYNSLKATEGLEMFPYFQQAIMYVNMNTKREPLNNKLVRKAIALALDRDAFNQGLYQGLGKVAWVPIQENQPYYKREWEYKRDIEQAKELLKQAGYPNGFEIRILALKGAEEIMGEVIYSSLSDIGIKGVIDVKEIPEALSQMLDKEDFDIAGLGDTISPDPDFFASKYLLPNGLMAALTGHWSNEEAIQLIEEGRGTLDMDKRVEIYQRLYDIVLEENPMVFVAWPVRFPVYRDYVEDFRAFGDIRYNWSEIWLSK